MSHTPGPWYDSRTTKAIKVTHESPAHQRGDFNVATYPTRTAKSLVSHEEWDANARLIAAAPDLLAACKLALEAFEKNYAIDWSELSSAIEKAEGKSSPPYSPPK